MHAAKLTKCACVVDHTMSVSNTNKVVCNFLFQIWVEFYVVISWVQYNACVDLTYSNGNGPSLHHYLRISVLGLWLYSYRKEILILANKKCKKIYMYGHLSDKLYLREDTLIV